MIRRTHDCLTPCRYVYLRDVIACRTCHRLDYASRHLHRSVPGVHRVMRWRRMIHAASIVTDAHRQQMDDTVFEKSMKGYGYLMTTAEARQLTIEMLETTGGIKQSFDTVTVNIANHRLV